MPVNVNVPFQVTIAADGTVSIQKVDVQTYTLTEANATFEGYLRDDILHSFKVEANGANPNAALYVTMDESNGLRDAFIAELKKQILQASMDNSGNSSVDPTQADIKNLEAYLLEWANSNLLEELKKNGIADALEADALDSLAHNNFETDAAKGAEAMHDGLDAMDPARLSVVASQIPNDKWLTAFNGVGDSGAPGASSAYTASRLPLEDGGDSMTFQFVITQNFVVSEKAPDSGASMMPGSVVNTGIGSSAGGIGPGANETLLGHYSVPTRIINLKLSRPLPSSYPAIKNDSYTMPSAADANGVDHWIGEVSTAGTTYNADVTIADTSFNAWNTANDKHIARVLADKRVSDATAFEAAARTAQSSALVQAGSDTTGPLYDAAQRAIEAAAIALADLSGCLAVQATKVAADLNADSATAGTMVNNLLQMSKAATEKVTSDFKTLTSAQNSLAEARAKLARDLEWYNHKVAAKAAAKESADTAAKVALDQWNDASANAISARSQLESVRADRNYADAVAQAWESERSSAQTAYGGNPSEANATRLKVAQDKKNEKAAILDLKVQQFNSQYAIADRLSSNADNAINTYVTAKSYTDSPFVNPDDAPSGFRFLNWFPQVASYSYVAPLTPVGLVA